MAPDYSVNRKGLALELTWEFLITYILTFACVILFVIPFKIHFVHILRNLCQLYIFTGILVQPLHIGHIIIGLYRTVSGARAIGSGQQTQKGPTTTISCTTTMRHIPGQESSMTNVGYME